MAETIKVLAQHTPAASTLEDAYTVGGGTSAVVSSIAICNQNTNDIKFRISIAVAGAVDATKQYIYYDVPLTGNATFVATIGMTLAATDEVRVYADDTNVSFNIFGTEIT